VEGIGDKVGDRPDGIGGSPALARRSRPGVAPVAGGRRAASPVSMPAGKWPFVAVGAAGLTAVTGVLAGG